MKKSVIAALILVLICLFGVWAFLSLGRAGGEVGFYAEVTSIEGDLVYATVTEDHAGFGSRKLPDTIVIYADEFPEDEFHIGDLIHGCYIRKEYNGDFYRVVSIALNNK